MMRFLALSTLIVLAPLARAETVKVDEIKRLIDELGATEFQKRELASRRLEKIGVPALDLLRRAEDKNRDAEVRRRAERIIDHIERTDPRLSKLREQRRIEGLVNALGNRNYQVYKQARLELTALGQKADPHLQKATKSKEPLLRSRATSLLRTVQRNPRKGK